MWLERMIERAVERAVAQVVVDVDVTDEVAWLRSRVEVLEGMLRGASPELPSGAPPSSAPLPEQLQRAIATIVPDGGELQGQLERYAQEALERNDSLDEIAERIVQGAQID